MTILLCVLGPDMKSLKEVAEVMNPEASQAVQRLYDDQETLISFICIPSSYGTMEVGMWDLFRKYREN